MVGVEELNRLQVVFFTGRGRHACEPGPGAEPCRRREAFLCWSRRYVPRRIAGAGERLWAGVIAVADDD